MSSTTFRFSGNWQHRYSKHTACCPPLAVDTCTGIRTQISHVGICALSYPCLQHRCFCSFPPLLRHPTTLTAAGRTIPCINISTDVCGESPVCLIALLSRSWHSAVSAQAIAFQRFARMRCLRVVVLILTTRSVTWNQFPIKNLLIDSNSSPVYRLVVNLNSLV